jgi:predicted RNA binding protein YcfA (HicA-like mRNA interferase family)
MSGKNLPLKTFRKFLEHHGMSCIRTKGGHEVWSKKNLNRPIVLQTHIDPVPIFIVKNNLRTMGLTIKDLETFLMSS